MPHRRAARCLGLSRGALHRPELRGGGRSGYAVLRRLLLALDDGNEDCEPAFRYVAPGAVPTETKEGVTTRSLLGPGSPLEGRLDTPAFLLDVSLQSGASRALPERPERAVYVLSGAVTVAEPGAAQLTATEDAHVLVLGGDPIGPRHFWWNYLHSSLETLEKARAAWRSGEVPLPAGDTESFTPAPPDDGRPLRRLNAPT